MHNPSVHTDKRTDGRTGIINVYKNVKQNSLFAVLVPMQTGLIVLKLSGLKYRQSSL